MTYKKETCNYCEALGVAVACTKCLGNGYLMIAERPHIDFKNKQLINNKPSGTGARDRFNYGINK